MFSTIGELGTQSHATPQTPAKKRTSLFLSLTCRQQQYTGACEEEGRIAAFVLTRVIGHYPDGGRNAIMVDAGATALSKCLEQVQRAVIRNRA